MLLAHVSWFGTIPAWLTFLTLIAVAVAVRGGAMGPAVGYLREANTTLDRRNKELVEQLANERKENARLRATRDLEPVQLKIVAAIETHEATSATRDQHVITILERIADRLEAPVNAA